MIVDVHTHFWNFPQDFKPDFIHQAERRGRAGTKVDLTVTYEGYRKGCEGHDVVALVFGGKAKLSGAWVDDKLIADFAEKHSRDTIGFLSVDPTQDGWLKELRDGHEVLGLKGIKLLPMYAGFKPNDPVLNPLWSYAQRNGLPVLLHTGTTFIAQAPLECTIPRLIEPVALKYPGVKIILAHLGHPYEGDCIVTIRKHPNVYADISALHYRPFQLYHSLMLVQEYGVWDKLFFGTDYPFTTVKATVDGLHKLNHMLEGTNLPRLNVEDMDSMINRDTLKVLGLKLKR